MEESEARMSCRKEGKRMLILLPEHQPQEVKENENAVANVPFHLTAFTFMKIKRGTALIYYHS